MSPPERGLRPGHGPDGLAEQEQQQAAGELGCLGGVPSHLLLQLAEQPNDAPPPALGDRDDRKRTVPHAAERPHQRLTLVESLTRGAEPDEPELEVAPVEGSMGNAGGHHRQTPGGEGDGLPMDHAFPSSDHVHEPVLGVRRLAVGLDALERLVHHEHDRKIGRLFRNRRSTGLS